MNRVRMVGLCSIFCMCMLTACAVEKVDFKTDFSSIEEIKKEVDRAEEAHKAAETEYQDAEKAYEIDETDKNKDERDAARAKVDTYQAYLNELNAREMYFDINTRTPEEQNEINTLEEARKELEAKYEALETKLSGEFVPGEDTENTILKKAIDQAFNEKDISDYRLAVADMMEISNHDAKKAFLKDQTAEIVSRFLIDDLNSYQEFMKALKEKFELEKIADPSFGKDPEVDEIGEHIQALFAMNMALGLKGATLKKALLEVTLIDQVTAVQEVLFEISTRISDYQAQRDILAKVGTLLADPAFSDPNLAPIRQGVTSRIQEIDAFLTKPPTKPSMRGQIEDELALWEKIPSDAARTVSKRAQEEMEALKNALHAENIEEQKQHTFNIEEVKRLAAKYGVPVPEEIIVASEVAKSVSETEELPLPEGTQPADYQEGGVFSTFLTGVKDTLSFIFKVLTFPVRVIADGMARLFNFTAKALVKKGFALQDLGDNLTNTPEMLAMVDGRLTEVNDMFQHVKPMAEWIPSEKLQAFAKDSDTILSWSKDVTESEITKSIARTALTTGKEFAKIGDYVVWLGEKIGSLAGDSFSKWLTVMKIDQVIKRERYAIREIPELPKKDITTAVKDTIGSWFTGIKDIITKGARALQTPHDVFNTKRSEILEILGLSEGATADAIQKAWESETDQAKLQQLQQLRSDLFTVAEQISHAHQETSGKLESTMFYIDVMSTGWDGLRIEEKQNLVDLVKSLFDLKNIKIEYLRQIKSQLDTLKGPQPTIGKPEDLYSATLLEQASKLVSENILDVLTDFEKIVETINTSLQLARDSLLDQLEKDYDAAHEPIIPPDIGM